MEKFTNPKRGHALVGGIRIPLRYLTTTNEQLLPLLLISFFTFLSSAILAQPLFTNTSTTIPNPLLSQSTSAQGGRSAPVFVDLDNNGIYDCFSGTGDGTVLFYRNIGTAISPNLQLQTGVANPFDGVDVGTNSKLAFVDIDDDGLQDCFIGNQDGFVAYFKGKPGQQFEEQFGPFDNVSSLGNPFDGIDVGAGIAPSFFDFDNDGDYDCFFGTGFSTNSSRLYRNDGTEEDPDFVLITGSYDGCLLTDLDGNPLSDASTSSALAALPNGVPAFADLDFDGDIDQIVGRSDGFFQYFRNTIGTGLCTYTDFTGFQPTSASSILRNNYPSGLAAPRDVGDSATPAFVDIDGDGDLDWFSGNQAGAFIFYENRSCRTEPVLRDVTNMPVSCAASHAPVTLAATPSPSVSLTLADFGVNNIVSGCTGSAISPIFSPATLNCIHAGTTVAATMTSTDPSNGESRTCTVNIQVQDATAPVLPMPNGTVCRPGAYYDITLDATGHSPMGTVNPNTVLNDFSDNCSFTLSVTNQPPSTFIFDCSTITSGPSPYQIILRATDPSGNFAQCTTDVRIRDLNPPVFSGTLPQVNLTRCGMSSATYGPMIAAPTATDNCTSGSIAGVPTVTGPGIAIVTGSNPYSFDFPVSGTYTITWTFSDAATPINSSTTTQTVVVTTTSLQWIGPDCPGPTTIPATIADANQCYATILTVPAPLADNCGNLGTIVYNDTRPVNNRYNVGTTTVVRSATLGANTINCVILVTVTDNQPPVVGSWTTPAVQTVPTPGTFINGGPNTPFNTGQSCGVVVNWTEPSSNTVTDNCAPPNTAPTRRVRYEFDAPGGMAPVFVPVTGYGPGSTFPPGTTRVTYDYVDAAGNASIGIYTFDIVVTDNLNPNITCPNPIVTSTTQGQCYADVFLPTPSGIFISDNCTLPSNAVTGPFIGVYCPPPTICTTSVMPTPMGQPNFYRFDKGVNNVHFNIVDAFGNQSGCSVSITVNDNEKPKFTNCLTTDVNLTAPTMPASCTANSTWAHPNVTDNCPPIPPILEVQFAGKTILPYTPVASVTLPYPFNEGESTVTYRVTDMGGLTETCSFKVKVINSIPPSFGNCPAFQGSVPTVNTDPGNCYYTLRDTSFATRLMTMGGGTGCDPGTMTFVNLSTNANVPIGTQLNPGNYVLRATLRDYSSQFNNLQTTCQFQVTIRDNQPPFVSPATIAVCNSTVTTNMSSGQCTGIPSFVPPAFQDNCAVTSTSATYQNLPTGNTGVYTGNTALAKGLNVLTFRASDSNNNQTACIVTVNVVDNQPPVFTNCPSGTQFVNVNGPSGCSGIYTRTLTATDNCGSVVITPVALPPSDITIAVDLDPSTMTLATTTVMYTATDAAMPSNSSTCVITVQARDVNGPVIPPAQCPSNITSTIGSPLTCTLPHPTGWADPLIGPGGITDCTGPVTLVSGPVAVAQNLTPIPVTGTSSSRNAQFPIGVNTVTYTYRDAVSPANTSTCTFTVTVVDAVPPVFVTCPSPITVSTDGNTCARTISTAYLLSLPPAQRPLATDGCSAAVTYTSNLTVGVSIFAPLSTTVFWTATDNSGNSVTGCSQTVQVSDLTNPTLTCGAPYTITALPNNSCVENNNSTYPTIVNPAFNPALPTPSDNCSSPSPIITRVPGQPGQYCVGTHQLSWLVTDGNGNTASCAQQITVLPSNICTATTPSFSGGSNCGSVTPFVLPNANCPASVTVTAAQLGLSATDNCGNALAIPNKTFNVSVTGTQTVTFTATVGLNTVNCTRTVSVTCNPVGPCTPNAVPTMAGCGGTINVNANASCQGVVASFGVTASDNCASRTVTAGNSGPFGLGSTTVTFTATNTVGSNSCTKTVVVTDATNPTFVTCPSDITIAAEAGEEFAFSANLDVPSATDNCSVSSVELAVGTPEMLFGDGNAVIWEATDGNGNVAECLQNVTVTAFGGGGVGCSDFLSIELASDGAGGDLYGYSVDVDGSRAIVGALFDDNGKGINSGAAYILEKNGLGQWVEVAKLLAPDGLANDQFGVSVAIDGGLVIVGSLKNAGKGAAYVFSGSGATWTLVKKLTASDGASSDDFGASVDITATHAIVGALNDDAPQVNRGSVYIFGKDQGGLNNWGQVIRQSASDGNTNDNFGVSVGIDGNFAVVGARYDDDLGANSGMVFVLAKDQGGVNNWGQLQKLVPSTGAAGDYYGSSVGISGNQIIAGSYLNDEQGNNAGSAYVFEYDGITWSEEVKLTASDATIADQFGISVSIESGVAVVGAHFDDDMGTNSGSAYVFTQSGIIWSEDKLTVPSVSTNDNFGFSVAIGGSSVVIGAYKDDISGLDQGSAYFFGCSNNPLRPAAKERTAVTTSTGGQVRCFPNPSTDMVNIDITLAEEENVQVIVSDITGKVISTIFDNKMSGENRLEWEGKQFGNGMYFIRIQSASLREVVPVVIVR